MSSLPIPATVNSDVRGDEPPRILVVEDELLIRHLAAEALRELGACAVEAASADEAWDYLNSGAVVDLLFTDHRMPGSMTGTQLAARVRQRYPDMAVIVTSAWPGSSDWPGTILDKPYNLGATARLLTELALEHRRQCQPHARDIGHRSAC